MDHFLPDDLDPVLALITSATLSSEAGAQELRAALEESFPDGGDIAEAITRRADLGQLTDKGEPPLKYGRHFSSKDTTHGISCDAVVMNGRAPDEAHHVHDGGEVVLCVALEGVPTFDGHQPGWIVFPEGHAHTPCVEGGTMAMIYFWPGGRATFPNMKKA